MRRPHGDVGARGQGTGSLRLLMVAVVAGVSLFALAGVASAVVSAPLAAAATAATAATGPTACGTVPAHLRYNWVLATPPAGNQTQVPRITSVVISDLTGCDGKTAKLVLSGNSAGDPTTTHHPLATATSTVGPCTQDPVKPAPTVQNDAITFDLCPTGGPAAYVSLHDVTYLTLSVGGTTVTISTITGSSSQTSSGGSSGSGGNVPVSTKAASSSGLAFTGADIAAMTGGGLLLILLGLFLLLISRRRRSQAPGDTAP